MLTDRDSTRAELHAALEEQYQLRTEQLIKLIGGSPAGDPAAQAAITRCRQALAEIARALRHMAEGRYGDCEGCGRPIPLARLEILPQARYCVPCQQQR